jgi:hypothetical protein
MSTFMERRPTRKHSVAFGPENIFRCCGGTSHCGGTQAIALEFGRKWVADDGGKVHGALPEMMEI